MEKMSVQALFGIDDTCLMDHPWKSLWSAFMAENGWATDSVDVNLCLLNKAAMKFILLHYPAVGLQGSLQGYSKDNTKTLHKMY